MRLKMKLLLPVIFAVTVMANIDHDDTRNFDSEENVEGSNPTTYSDHQDSADSDYQESTYSDHQKSAYSDHQESAYSDHQGSAESDHQESADSDYQESTYSDHQESAYSDHQESSDSEHQESSDSEHQETAYSDHQEFAYSDHQESADSDDLPTAYLQSQSSASLNDPTYDVLEDPVSSHLDYSNHTDAPSANSDDRPLTDPSYSPYSEEEEEDICENGLPYCPACEGCHDSECPVAELFRTGKIIRDTPVPEGGAKGVLSVPEGFMIAKSKIKYAGRGVHAYHTFHEGTIFGPYQGEILPYSETIYSEYIWLIYRRRRIHHFVDGKDIRKSNWIRYVNGSPTPEEKNVKGIQYNEEIYYIVEKTIYPGDEMLVWYGNAYMDNLKQFVARKSAFDCPICGRLFGSLDLMHQHEVLHLDTLTQCVVSEKYLATTNANETFIFGNTV